MNNSNDQLKTQNRRNMEFFFGEDLKMTNGKYFIFKRHIDNDNVIVLTKNIKKIKEQYVFICGLNKGVYLKDFQIRKVSSYKEGINCYAVKLNRKYYKPYTFSFDFNEVEEHSNIEFDELIRIADKQDKEQLPVKEGWIKNL